MTTYRIDLMGYTPKVMDIPGTDRVHHESVSVVASNLDEAKEIAKLEAERFTREERGKDNLDRLVQPQWHPHCIEDENSQKRWYSWDDS